MCANCLSRAATNAPCIVFIDEIDSIGRSRRMGSLNSEQENTLNQLLTSMDGLDTSNNGVIVMAATNRYELLDQALLRAGRFDRIIQCPLPDKSGREAILKVHCRRLQISSDVDLKRLHALHRVPAVRICPQLLMKPLFAQQGGCGSVRYRL